MDCCICLNEFETDYAYIPELPCSCIIIVHEECWERWNGRCLYCRMDIQEAYPVLHNDYAKKRLLGMAILVCLILFFSSLINAH